MLHQGADLSAVSAQLGHARTSTTSDIYAHVLAGAQKKTAQKLPSLDHFSAPLKNR
ncbi:MAG: hypothetical protein JRC92_03400 [Deltaproteobacteria bacterium]|nr:hypothetical protein [Deltaproteobacteria bacterium]